MSEDGLFILAEQTFAHTVARIAPQQLDMALPEWFQLGSNQDRASLRLRDILNYHAYDTAWVPAIFAGQTMAEAGADRYDGDLLGEAPLAAYQGYSDAAVAAIRQDYDPGRTVHYSYGDYPAREAITHIACFRVFRAYDFAKLIGVDRALPEELSAATYRQFAPHAEEWRHMGIFQPAVPEPAHADAQARLFAMVGRDPAWQA